MFDKVLITGTNDNATACAIRLFRSGFAVSMISPNLPTDLYYFRNFSTIIASGSKIINGIKAQTCADFLYHQQKSSAMPINDFIEFSFGNRHIPVLSETEIKELSLIFNYCVICDAGIFKALKTDPSVTAIISCVSKSYDFPSYRVIISGPHTGQVCYPFLDFVLSESADNTGIQVAAEEGVFIAEKQPGDVVHRNEKVATLAGKPVIAEYEGRITGIMHSGIIVPKGQAIIHISDKFSGDVRHLPQSSVAVAGGVLEALLYDKSLNG